MFSTQSFRKICRDSIW